MSMAQFAGQHLMPFIARLVLGAAFLLAGWHLCFGSSTPIPGGDGASPGTTQAVSVAYIEDQPPAQAPATPVESSPAAVGLAGMLDDAGFGGWSTACAWAAATVSLAGGGLLIVGLLTRVVALLLLAMVGTGFWASSIHLQRMFDRDPLHWAADSVAFSEMFLLLTSGVLLLGILLIGPGVCALDHVIWPRQRPDPDTALDTTDP